MSRKKVDIDIDIINLITMKPGSNEGKLRVRYIRVRVKYRKSFFE